MNQSAGGQDADVIIVGAGPAGATAAYYLAQAGLSVIALEKTGFPREKVCGDGLTPRAVAELIKMGVPIPEDEGWIRNKGLRVVGGGHRLELTWPEIAEFPDFGLVRTRRDFDQILAEHARAAGATILEQTSVTGPIFGERSGRVIGVTARPVDGKGRKIGDEQQFRAPVVIAADGVSARMALALGLERREDRPMGVAVRTYYKTPRHNDDWMESWLELWDGEPGRGDLLPGYGWIFGVGDGTANVGLGMLNSSPSFGKVDYRELLTRWVENTPAEWEFNESTQVGPIRSAALPMAFNRSPLYSRGMLLVGDAGGMVSPFNGEGISYAMESGRIAADIVASALARPTFEGQVRVLRSYPGAMKQALGGYYQLGRVFVELIGHPQIMKICTTYGLPRPVLMQFTNKLLAHLYDTRDGDWMDRLLTGLTKVVPSA